MGLDAKQERLREAAEANDLQDRIGARHAKALRKAIEDGMIEVARQIPAGGRPEPSAGHFRAIDDTMRRLYRDMTRAMAERMVDRFKSGFEWLETKASEDGFYERLYEEYLQSYGGQRIAQISETTRSQIVRMIEQGLKEGMSVDEIAQNIVDRAPEIAELRAAIISRTETHSAAMFASINSAKRSTLPLNKEWISVEDSRTRDFGEGDGEVDEFSHRAMDGVTVPLDDPFEVPTRFGSTEQLMYPGDPAGSAANVINCRCAQTYVPADAEQGPRPQTQRPAGDERARILDRIRGELPTFSNNQDGAFDRAPLPALSAIFKAGDLKRMIKDRKGAYADFDGGISMGKHTPGGEDYRRVFRHEYGHFIDDQIAKARREPGQSNLSARFASWRAIEDLVEDGDELLARRSKTFMGDKQAASSLAARNGEAYLDRVDELEAAYNDPDQLLRDLIPEVEPEDVWRLYGGATATNRSPQAAARIAAAWERRDVGQAISDLPARLSGERVSHSSPFAGLQDTFEASNGGNIRIMFGHGKSYYTSNNRWTEAAGLAGRFGRRKFNAYATGQAFANFFEAYGDPNPATYALYRRLYPRTAQRFEEMLEEFVNG
jgi:hypothetical protein